MHEELGPLWVKPITKIDVPVRLLAAGMYATHVCMFAKHVCMFTKLVCMFAKLVCMLVKLVCMSGKNHTLETRSDSLRIVFSILCLIQLFKICEGGTVDAPDIQNIFACEAHYTHTCIHTYQLRDQKPLQRAVF